MNREPAPAVADVRAVNRLNLADRGVARVARCCVIVRDQQVVLKHVPDVNMPGADFLTKWIPIAKLDQSIIYATGAHN